MSDLIVFAGTAEGRELSEFLSRSGVSVHVCVATEYGGSLIQNDKNITVSSTRLGDEGMLRLFRENGARTVVDATHPYAVVISRKIKSACSETGLEYIRLLRPKGSDSYDGFTTMQDMDSAVEFLKGTKGNVLVTTGSKDLAKFTDIEGYKDRIYARVLSLPEVVSQCSELGFIGKNLICMQGPFNEDLNYGMMKQLDIGYMVTKDSGDKGGFDEKMRAASRAGVKVILIGRPPDEGITYDEVVSLLSKRFKLRGKEKEDRKRRNVWIIGAGMGSPGGMTVEAAEACRNADVVIGPQRMIDTAGTGKKTFNEYRPDRVIEYMRGHPELMNVAIVFSGDIGFYSGAKKIVENADPEWNIIPVCGISSVMYLCSKFCMPWQDVHLMSAHGIDSNIIGEIKRNGKVFCLLSKGSDIKRLCEKLMLYDMEHVKIIVGDRLGYDDERIAEGYPKEIIEMEFTDLSVILSINERPDLAHPLGIPDAEFIRGDVPMTKSEIRTLTVAKLGLRDDSVVYDIGAGTGSVSVEMARVAVNGKIYSIEREKDALELIQKNKERFGADNLHIIEGSAPEVLEDLPVPTHAFIGGSGGKLMETMDLLMRKNPDMTIAVNSITIETAFETLRCVKELGFEEIETICVSVSRARATENAHLMIAQNPIYITLCRGKSK